MPYTNTEKQKKYQKEWNHNSDNIRKKELGIPFGTASHRLRQILFFELLKETGKNICYDCGGEITKATDVSIQHKKVWLHIDPNLFWDLDNIAFSHKKCNKTERTYRKGQLSPHGTVTRYNRQGCRCEQCRIAGNKRKQIWRSKNKLKKGSIGVIGSRASLRTTSS